jgi:hypothetical protein
MIELLLGIIEAIVSLITGLIETIASLFVAGGEAIGAGEAIIILFVVLIEILYWVILWLIELVVSLVQWRKPENISKPVIWRPTKKQRNSESQENAEL